MTNQPYYETMYILRPDIAEEEVESHISKYNEEVTVNNAEVLDSQMRGKRRLAYPIAKHKEGIYVQLSHKGDGKHVKSLEKAMRLSEDVIRYLTVKQNGPLPTPRTPSNSEKASEEKEDTKAEKKKEVKLEKSESKSESKSEAKSEKKDDIKE
tara:strand:- start:3 stop:461 length:459 start_codon:yes stop_codon:yes gene_type:complete